MTYDSLNSNPYKRGGEVILLRPAMAQRKPAEELRKYIRVIDDQDICIGCGACVSVCPYQAWELDENGKARLIWDLCYDDFSCIPVCPVNCIWKTPPESPETARKKDGWYRFSHELTPEEQKVFEEWAQKYGITGKPAKTS